MWSFFSKDPSKDLNYELQECVSSGCIDDKTIWSVHNGKKKSAPNELVTVFAYQVRQGAEAWFQPAKNGIKRTKMLRHPNLLAYIDGLETDKAVYYVTERVQPLSTYLRESQDSESQKENEISWGLHQVATALSFINNDCKLIHNNVNLASVFVNKAGEWKLNGLDFVFQNELNGTMLEQAQLKLKILPSLDRYEPPEKCPASLSSLSFDHLLAIDAWGLACLISEIFNGAITGPASLKHIGRIPKRLQATYNELINSNPTKRLSCAKFVEKCCMRNGYMDNHFVNTLLFLEKLQIKEQAEKNTFFTELTEKLDDFPRNLCLFKILPQLINAYEFANAGSSILAPLFKLGKLLDDGEYQKKIIPIVVKLFSSTDRTTRMRLLQQLHLFVEHLTAAVINDQIFPHICQGFMDSNPSIRETTIRSIVLLAPKLNYNNLNIELMKHFARLQGQDDQGMIRTNTTVCIGKIAPFINPQLRQRILLSAFPKAMRDPFIPARLSGIVALANTEKFYTLKDIATKVMPSLCIACVDPDKDVRDESFKTIKMFLAKLEKVSANPELAIEMEKDINACNLDLKNETSWTSWAMTSLSAKMTGYKNKNQQPSVSLSTASGEHKKTIENISPTKTASSTDSPNLKKNELQTSDSQSSFRSDLSQSVKKVDEASKPVDSGNGWEDDNWKDMDDFDEDGGQMEPLEMNNKFSMNLSTSKQSSSENWGDWGADDTGDNASKSSSGTKPASSYNWNTFDSKLDEEDLFNSLVGDTKKLSTNNSPKPKATNDWSNDFDSWGNDSFDTGANKKAEREQRNAEKQKELNAKKQSKPMKLGSKT